MSFQANVLRIMIASPGDVAEERKIVTEQIHRWNDANARARQLVLLPVKWETHSTPQLGSRPQTILNHQILEDADILIGVFGTRIGTPTEEHASGTVEEIKRHVAAGKTAKVYFSDVPVAPSAVNEEQYASVKKFKEELQQSGLYATYKTLQQFKEDFSHHLDIELNQPRYRWLTRPSNGEAFPGATITADELKMLKLAASEDGSIVFQRTLSGYGVRAGEEELSDGTPRSEAKWKGAARKLVERGAIEELSEGIYNLTDVGYALADSAEPPERAVEQITAFDQDQTTYARGLLNSLDYKQRDFLRFLLLQGGAAPNYAVMNAVADKPSEFNMNDLVTAVLAKGLITREDNRIDGYVIFSVNDRLISVLKGLLFPRDEGTNPPVYHGISRAAASGQ